MQEKDKVDDGLVVELLWGGERIASSGRGPPRCPTPPFSPLLVPTQTSDAPSPSLPVLSLSKPCRHHSISWR